MDTRNKNIPENGLRKPVFHSLSEPQSRLGQWLRLVTARVRNEDMRKRKTTNRYNECNILMI